MNSSLSSSSSSSSLSYSTALESNHSTLTLTSPYQEKVIKQQAKQNILNQKPIEGLKENENKKPGR